MRKALKIFAALFLAAAAAVALKDNLGAVSVEWLGFRLTTNLPVALALAWLAVKAVKYALKSARGIMFGRRAKSSVDIER